MRSPEAKATRASFFRSNNPSTEDAITGDDEEKVADGFNEYSNFFSSPMPNMQQSVPLPNPAQQPPTSPPLSKQVTRMPSRFRNSPSMQQILEAQELPGSLAYSTYANDPEVIPADGLETNPDDGPEILRPPEGLIPTSSPQHKDEVVSKVMGYQTGILDDSRRTENFLWSSSHAVELDTVYETQESQQQAKELLVSAMEKYKRTNKPAMSPIRESIKKFSMTSRKAKSTKYPLTVLSELLERAARAGNLPLVESIFNLGADANFSCVSSRTTVNSTRHSALQIAAEEGHSNVVEYIIRRGSHTIAINEALISASLGGFTDLARNLISNCRADINFSMPVTLRDDMPFDVEAQYLYTNALGLAAKIIDKDQRIAFVQFLLNTGAKVDNLTWKVYKTAKGSIGYGYSPLALFVPICPTSIGLLLDAGASVNVTPYREPSIDEFPAGGGPRVLEVVHPISCVADQDWEFYASECVDIITTLVTLGADPNVVENNGMWNSSGKERGKRCPLSRAINACSVEGVQLLVHLGASLTKQFTFEGARVLPSEPSPAFVQAAQAFGVQKFAAPFNILRTPLNYAAHQGNPDIIQALIGLGADIYMPSMIHPASLQRGPETALTAASKAGHVGAAQVLLANGVNPSDGSLHKAAHYCQLAIVRLLLDRGARVSHDLDILPLSSLMNIPPESAQRLCSIPRGNPLVFAMYSTSQCRDFGPLTDDYDSMLRLLIAAFRRSNVPIGLPVLQAAIDTDNEMALQILMEEVPAWDPARTLRQARLSGFVKTKGWSLKEVKGLPPVEYATAKGCSAGVKSALLTAGADGWLGMAAETFSRSGSSRVAQADGWRAREYG